MNHACNRGTAAIFDIGCGTRDRARRRNTAKQGGNNIPRALCHQLRVGTVFSADHAVRYHAGKQRLNRRQNCNRKRIRQGTLKAMINQTSFAVSTNESRPVHTGSLFEVGDQDLTVVSVDGFRLALRREPLDRAEGGAFKFVAPGSALNEVEKICEDSDEKVTIIQGKRHLLFEAGATQLICRRLEGDFLDYKNAIPRNNPIRLTVDTKTMLGSLDRVSVVISEKLKSPVRCVFENGRVLLSAKTGAGEAKDICPLDGDGNGLEIGFNNRYLMDALRYAPADSVTLELNTSISPAVIVPADGEESFLYMVLPVRLKA